MGVLKQLFLVIAVVLFLLASWPPANSRVTLGWLGLAFFAATWLIP